MNKQDLMRKRNDAIRTVRHSNKVGYYADILVLDDCDILPLVKRLWASSFIHLSHFKGLTYEGVLHDVLMRKFGCTPPYNRMYVIGGI